MTDGRCDDHRCCKKGHCPIGRHCILIPLLAGDAWQSRRNPSVLHEDGISEHTAYDMQLDTISVIEANISKHPYSHGSTIRSYVSSHIIPSLMTRKEHRSAASCGRVRIQTPAYSLYIIILTILRRGINDLGYLRVTLVVRINLATIRLTDRVWHNVSCF